MQHQRYDLALHSIFNYVKPQELFNCALVSVEWNQYATLKLWRYPKFGNDSKTSFQSFQSFLDILLNTAREQARLCVFIIDVNKIQESLYETVNENWLGIVVSRCPNLRELIIRNISFLSTIHIRNLCNMKVHNFVEILDLTGAKDITESTMKALIQNLPELKSIILDNCSGVTDGSISQITYFCHNLEYVNIANSRSSLTDVGIYALAKFGKQKLKGIELTASMKVTCDAIIAMSSHCTKLVSINFSNCALITIQGLEKIVASNKNTLKQLIIHNMRSIPSFTYPFFDLLANHCPQLMKLSFSFTAITDIKIELLNDIFDKFKTLKDLILYDVPENVSENTPNFSLWRLIEQCKSLKEVTIYRTSYESDFILGGYARVLGGINQQAVDEFNVFHPGIKVNLLLLEE